MVRHHSAAPAVCGRSDLAHLFLFNSSLSLLGIWFSGLWNHAMVFLSFRAYDKILLFPRASFLVMMGKRRVFLVLCDRRKQDG